MGERRIGEKVSVSIYDHKFNQLSVVREGDAPLKNILIPENFSKLCETAEKLSKDFPHVRVDLYDNENEIMFGELTFYNASGYMKYVPDEFDYEIGKKFDLQKMV